MTKHLVSILFTVLALAVVPGRLSAETATMSEAENVATNWISQIVHGKGSWGDAPTAEVGEIEAFKRGERTVGYLCHVEPKGHIVVSFVKGLAPVKAYSTTYNLCDADEGLPDLLKKRMESLLDAIENRIRQTGPFQTKSIDDVVDINYLDRWDTLTLAPQVFNERLSSFETTDNYIQGQILLSSNWTQGDPYNRHVPAASGDCDEAHCAVGCVAMAASQIMHYWSWPPFGVGSPYNDWYGWINMPDQIDASSPSYQINAIANLCAEVGLAVGMDYCSSGCASSAPTEDIEAVYENQFRYSNFCTKLNRVDYGWEGWWHEIKIQLNSNQPIQYRVVGHSLVCDGWQDVGGLLQYHMNLGWAGSRPDKPCWNEFPEPNTNTWYTLDALPCSDVSEEYMMVNIYPVTALRHAPSGYYPRDPFNFRYVNQDAAGTSVTFAAGQNIQFLPRAIMTCASGYVDFDASSAYPTMLFTRGDMSRGVMLHNGQLRLHPGGSIQLP